MLVRNENRGGMMVSIFRPQNEAEQKAYQSLVDSVMPVCPRCYTELKIKPEDMYFEVSNPLTQTMGMDLGVFRPRCPKCKGVLEVDGEIDLDQAFPSAVNILKHARENYARQKGASNGKR